MEVRLQSMTESLSDSAWATCMGNWIAHATVGNTVLFTVNPAVCQLVKSRSTAVVPVWLLTLSSCRPHKVAHYSSHCPRAAYTLLTPEAFHPAVPSLVASIPSLPEAAAPCVQ